MKQIFVVKKGSLTQPSKVELREAGILVAEVDDLNDYKLTTGEVIDRSEMLACALKALTSQGEAYSNGNISAAGRQQVMFVRELARLYGEKKP